MTYNEEGCEVYTYEDGRVEVIDRRTGEELQLSDISKKLDHIIELLEK